MKYIKKIQNGLKKTKIILLMAAILTTTMANTVFAADLSHSRKNRQKKSGKNGKNRSIS